MDIFLEFEVDGVVTTKPCAEMPGFDVMSNKLKQEPNRWGRDKIIGAEESDLIFWNAVYVKTDQVYFDEHGFPWAFKTHCFEELLEISNQKNKGFEAIVRLVLKEGSTVVISGQLDFAESKTDERTYISCNIVVETKRALVDRRDDFEVDVFSDTDVDGLPNAPLQMVKFLQKSLPEFQVSKYVTPNEVQVQFISSGGDLMIVNPAIQADGTLGVENSYIPFATSEYFLLAGKTDAEIDAVFDRFKINTATEDFSNFTIDLSGINAFIGESTGFSTRKVLSVRWGSQYVGSQGHEFFSTTGTVNLANQAYSFVIPKLQRGEKVWLHFLAYSFNPSPAGGPISTTDIILSGMKVKASGYSYTIDTVIEVVRYEDYFNKGVEKLSGIGIFAPRLDLGQEFGDIFTFNGNMCKPGLNKPFNFVFKDEAEDLKMHRLDYQTSQTVIDIADKDDFYPNVDLGFLDLVAPADIEKSFDERKKINLISIEFNNYEKSDDTENTNESFHTKGQWNPLNKGVENKFEIKINSIWDPKKIQKTLQQALRATTATDNDNAVYRIDAVSLSPDAKGGFPAVLGIQSINNVVKILNKDPLSDIPAVFKWTQTGVSVGQQFWFDYTLPDGNTFTFQNTVTAIEDTVLTLAPAYFSLFNGSYLIVTSFYYTGVNWTNRTLEGFTDVSGLSIPQRWSNLRFGPANILDRYSSDINEIMAAYPNSDLVNLSFVNNPDFTARYNGGRLIRQGANLAHSDMRPKVLDNSCYKTKCKVSFQTGSYVIEAMTRRNPDNTIGGFFRIPTNAGVKKIHIDDSGNVWRDGILEINKGVVRNESDNVLIVVADGITYIDGAAYPKGINWSEVNSDERVTAFDEVNRPIINPTNYRKLSINGVLYENVVDFIAELENIS